MRAHFIYHFHEDILIIHDCGGPRSATNDMEEILRTIHLNHGIDLSSSKIIYSDSFHMYDAVVCENVGPFLDPAYVIDFIIFQTPNQSTAINKINEHYERSKSANASGNN